MKKHQLLEKAMRDYPAGTKFRWDDREFTSTGIFLISEGCVLDTDGNIIYDCADNWVETVNENMKTPIIKSHDNVPLFKGDSYFRTWVRGNGDVVLDKGKLNNLDTFHAVVTGVDGAKAFFFHSEAREYADIQNSKPKFIMTSKDGVNLYKGDTAHHVRRNFYDNGVEYNGTFTITGDGVSEYVFSSYEAAEKWIAEQNRSKEIKVMMDGGSNYATVTKNSIEFYSGNSNTLRWKISGPEASNVIDAFQSLQCDKTVSS